MSPASPAPGGKAVGLDVLVNNAGFEARTSVLETSEEQYQKVLDINPEAPISASTMADPGKLKSLDSAIPLGRMAKPEEITRMAVVLASGTAACLTSTSVVIDGGIMQKRRAGRLFPRDRAAEGETAGAGF